MSQVARSSSSVCDHLLEAFKASNCHRLISKQKSSYLAEIEAEKGCERVVVVVVHVVVGGGDDGGDVARLDSEKKINDFFD